MTATKFSNSEDEKKNLMNKQLKKKHPVTFGEQVNVLDLNDEFENSASKHTNGVEDKFVQPSELLRTNLNKVYDNHHISKLNTKENSSCKANEEQLEKNTDIIDFLRQVTSLYKFFKFIRIPLP